MSPSGKPFALRYRMCWILLFLGYFPVISAAAVEATPLAIGEQRSYPVMAGARFSVGNPEVIRVRVTQVGNGKPLLIVKGKSQGYSDLVLFGGEGVKKTWAFRVVTKREGTLAQANRRFFSRGSGLVLQPEGQGWLLRGSTKSARDWNIAKVIAEQAHGKVADLAHLHPLARLRAQNEIQSRLRAAGISQVEVRGAGSLVLLKGFASSKSEKDLAEALAKEVLRDVHSQITVPFEAAGRLRFRAKLFELLRRGSSSLGLDWEGAVGGGLKIAHGLAHGSFSLDAGFKLLERQGHARLLSQPELLLNERGVAELKVGGEFPISLRTKNTASVAWKPYGLLLRLELPGMNHSRARANIKVEISTLDPAHAHEGVPALRISKMETQVDMELGRPILLSGLTETRSGESEAFLPLLGEIPILGKLFRSRDFQENKSELVILLEAER